MVVDLVSLAVIAVAAFLCPLIAQAIPGKPVPETVFLLIAGMLLGPHMANAIQASDALSLLSDLGLAFLFLLAGYEINPRDLTGRQGRRGLATWVVTMAIAFVAVVVWQNIFPNDLDRVSVAIALTTTALGTLLPILQERNLMGTRIGNAVRSSGTWGELCPIVAIALLLSTRASWVTMLILTIFALVAVAFAVIPKRARLDKSCIAQFIARNVDTNAQMLVRAVMVLLIGLTALSAVFDLDIVLGAFAAGFALRYVVPEGSTVMEKKLNAIAFGFFIPLFFILSGSKINLFAVFAQPLLLIEFIVLLLLVRAAPIFIALSTDRETRDLSSRSRITISLYCTTALPLIVAVTSLATSIGIMDQETASVLVAAGGITVLLMPLLASATLHVADARPIEAVKEIRESPRDIRAILRDHWELERMLARQEEAARLAAHRGGAALESIPWQDLAAGLQHTSARHRVIDEALDEAAQRLSARCAESDDEKDCDCGALSNRRERRKILAEVALRETRRHLEELQAVSKREEKSAQEDPDEPF